MEETDPLSELGARKDVMADPLYQISSTGAFMNKRTLKMLKHFRHKDCDEPSVTLYRFGKGLTGCSKSTSAKMPPYPSALQKRQDN